ncbi:ATPase [Campylobacterota bacterium]|nr:ATPase [Campylobacterota bacterium]
MQRNLLAKLIAWKQNEARKPLLIDGARQVGKTWLMQEFGKTHYKKVAYINFELDVAARAFFENNLYPEAIVNQIEYKVGFKIGAEDTLIIFDEIQECNRALASLKYFCENAPQYQIIAAGSLLGVAIHQGNSFPVGKVDRLELYPMSFAEFLNALDEKRYEMIIRDKNYRYLSAIESELIARLKQYYFVGGMPKAVQTFVQTGDYDQVRNIQRDILRDYGSDFSKHIDAPSIPRVGLIWDSLPRQLAKENKQFIYRDMKEGARASQFESAFYWLERVGLAYKINRIETPSLPLAAYGKDVFKLYMLDVGLLSACSGLTLQNLAESDNKLFGQFKGALTEQFVFQELKSLVLDSKIYYWANDKSKGTAEVDFLIQFNGEIIPIEVKAERNLQAKSLQAYIKYYQPKTAIRSSLGHYGKHDTIWDIPLYLIAEFGEIIGSKGAKQANCGSSV